MEDKDYKEVLEKISTPIVVALADTKRKDSEARTKFIIHFYNESFGKTYGTLVKIGDSGKKCIELLSKEIDWYKMANDCLETGISQIETFYSTICSSWLRIHMNSTQNGFIIIAVVNVSIDKEREQQLLRQNLRLAALTD
ncbi:MAG: hypothetical protein IJ727_05295, partial [Treponema sp.]|nr:hypothetical protein [Treponema sp.]